MNLVIDIGNTCVKAALFQGSSLFNFKIYQSKKEVLIDSNFFRKAKYAIVGSVVDNLESFYSSIKREIPTIIFDSEIATPLTNLYLSSSTLGSDRLAASVGANALYPNSNVLVVDAGTCIKYNFINSKNEYLGGSISPGIEMKFKALENFTSKLPCVKFNKSYSDLIGTNTENSILSGVLNGTIAEIDGLISLYKSNYPDLICILTGGDSEYLAKRLKNSIFAHQNLVLYGLNEILNYNLEKK